MIKVLFCIGICFFCLTYIQAETYHIFKENGKVGLKDDQGNIIIPASYEELGWTNQPFSVNNKVVGYKINGLWGVLNINNTKVTDAQFIILNPSEGDYLVAYKRTTNNKTLGGCLSASGKTVIPFQYDGIQINSLRAIVNKKLVDRYVYGLLDMNNKVVVPMEFKNIESVGSLRYAVKNFQDGIALYSEGGVALTDFNYNTIQPFKNNLCIVSKDGFDGILSRDGKVLVPCTYEQIYFQEDGSVTGVQQNIWSILDGKNTVLSKMIADSIISLGNNLFALRQESQFELVNAQFGKVTEEKFDEIGPFNQNKSIVKQNGKTGIVSSNGNLLIPCEYQRIMYDKNYVLAMLPSRQWVLLDSTGNRKTPKSYQQIQLFNGVYFAAKNRDYYGAINAEGKEVIACVYDSIIQYMSGKLVVKFHGAYGIIGMDEEWIIPPQEHFLQLVSTDRYLQQKKTTTFLKSYDNNIIYFTENNIIPKDDYLVETISTGGLWKIDFDGRIMSRQLPPKDPFEYIFPESEGLRGIKKNGQYGFVDDEGRLRIANRYEGIQPFQERLAAVRILGKWGFIDHDEKLAIQPVYEETTDFKDGIAIVKQKNQYGLINNKGQVILPIRFDKVFRLHSKRFLIETGGLKGLADFDGRQIVAPKYDNVVDINNGYIIIGRTDKYGLITLQGLSTIPLMYDMILYDHFNDRYLALTKGSEQSLIIPGK